MRDPRFAATATTLADGRVLIAGGVANEGAAGVAAELYDPASGGFVLTGGMLSGRAYHTATRLEDGRVLIAGGLGKDGRPVRAAELYDPASGQFVPTGNMLQPRYDHTATRLPSGKVLLTGGNTTTAVANYLGTAELYDPATGTFSPTGKVTRLYNAETDKFFYEGEMNAARAKHTATMLADGKVLIAGGAGVNEKTQASAEVYDPASGQFTVTGAMVAARQDHRATLLQSGQVLISGGYDGEGHILASAELYDPATGKFSLTTTAFATSGTAMSEGRREHTATMLADGQVLIAGGSGAHGAIATAELYNPADGAFTCVGGVLEGPRGPCNRSMNDFRDYASAAGLRDGKVLIAGGYNFRMSLARNPAAARGAIGGASVPFTLIGTAEVYDPAAGTFTSTLTLLRARYGLPPEAAAR